MSSLVLQSIKGISRFMHVNSPVLLTFAAVNGVFVTAAMSAEATPDAIRDIEAAEKKKRAETGDPSATLTKVEKIRTAAPHYVPTALSGVLTSLLMVKCTSDGIKRTTALSALAMSGQNALTEHRLKTEDMFGKESEKAVNDAIAKQRVDRLNRGMVAVPGSGPVLCFDNFSQRFFMSDIETIRRGLNSFNHALLGDIYKSLNEFYEYISPLDSLGYGEEIGFNPSRGMAELSYSSILTADGTPCLVIDFRPGTGPRLGYTIG